MGRHFKTQVHQGCKPFGVPFGLSYYGKVVVCFLKRSISLQSPGNLAILLFLKKFILDPI